MLLGELQAKDVINVVDGTKMGRINNMEIDITTGKIVSIIVQTNTRLMNFFTGSNNIVIPWNQIVKIGGEVVIVNYSNFLK
ncbi:MAG: YlmC/YmxH family sporulation protein [Bacilli bacterium]|nr:YlmC/YmxH family sporulation protein [Bacilli bacterium]MDD4388557.1 YlmC/YmxH family sporulation protein [Bacilli bacterium]